MECLDDSALEALVKGALRGEALERVEEALDGCAHCRRRAGELARGAEQQRSVVESDTQRAGFFEPGPDPYLGVVLGGRYRVTRLLGRGGMGAVYEAEHELIGRRVAIKLLHPELAARREVLSRFRGEARAAGAIGHPGIVQALDVGRTEGGAPFLVLEHLEGEDLETVLSGQGTLGVTETIELGVALADALAAAHRAGIVHRDLKPANVFRTEEGKIKVLDFGISKVRAGLLGTGPETRSGALLGTPAYMAPEQLRDASQATPSSDVYALGAILHRCLTGELPYAATSLLELLEAAEKGPPPSCRERRPEVSEALERLLRRTLDPAPSSRPASMEALRDALSSLSSTTRQTTARPLGPASRRLVLAVVCVDLEEGPSVASLASRAAAVRIDGEHPSFVLGEGSWSADLVTRAARLALDLSPHARRVVVGTATRAEGRLEWATDLAADVEGADGPFMCESLAPARMAAVFRDPDSGRLHHVPSAARPPRPPLVGRRAELAQLEEAREEALDAALPVVVSVEGPVGVGKTRLLEAFARSLADDFRVLRIGARPTDSDLGIVRAILWVATGLDSRSEPDMVQLALGSFGDSQVDRLALATLFGAADSGVPARLAYDRARLAAADLLRSLAEERPMALIIDDAQWADDASMTLLGQLLARLRVPLLVLLSGREAPDVPWMAAPSVVRVRPRPLRPRQTARLLSALLEARPEVDADRVARWSEEVHQRTGGNPLFVEQLGRSLVLGEGSPRSLDTSDVPLAPSLEGAIQARLDELAPALAELLRRASVFEVDFGAADLAALGVEVAEGDLASLVQAGLLRASADGTLYALEPPLLAEVAYRMLDDEVRGELHRRAAARLEGRVGLAQVATHWERGGKLEEASRCYEAACHAALAAGDVAVGLHCGQRALSLGHAAHPVRLRRSVADALEARGRYAEQVALLEQAERDAGEDEVVSVRTDRAVGLQRLGRSADALALLEANVGGLTEAVAPATAARARGKFAAALAYAGRLDDAAEQLGRAERIVLTKAPELRAEAAVWRGQLAAMRGDLGEARNAYWAAVELYSELGDVRRAAEASVNLADLYNRVGAHDEAVPALREGLDVCERVGARLVSGYGWVNLGYALLKEGELDESDAALDEAARIAREVEEARLRLAERIYRSRNLAARGRLSTALSMAVAVCDEAQERVFGGLEALARVAAAEHALAQDDTTAALAHAERAMLLRDGHGGLEEEGGALFLVLATALERVGRADEAKRMRERGRATVQAAARRIGDPHWRERFQTDVAAHRTLLEET